MALQQERLQQVREVENIRSSMVAKLSSKIHPPKDIQQEFPESSSHGEKIIVEKIIQEPTPKKKKSRKLLSKKSPAKVLSKSNIKVSNLNLTSSGCLTIWKSLRIKAMCHTDDLLWSARKIASMALPAARERHAKNVWHIALKGENHLQNCCFSLFLTWLLILTKKYSVLRQCVISMLRLRW